MTNSTDAEKVFDKIQNPFIIKKKNTQQTRNRRKTSSTLASPLDCKEIQPVHPKGDQSWVFIGRTDVEAETPILWPPDVKG